MKWQQLLTTNDTVNPISNGIHNPITENHRTSISISSIDQSFKKLELKICELNEYVNDELSNLGFLSQPFANQQTAGEGERYFCNC